MTILLHATNETGVIGRVELCDIDRVGRMLDRPALEIMLDRFRTLAANVVGFQGSDVAAIADGVATFTASGIDSAVSIGLEIIDRAAADPLLPDVRVRISYDDGPSVVLGALSAASGIGRAQNG